jgi:hypothetical protein
LIYLKENEARSLATEMRSLKAAEAILIDFDDMPFQTGICLPIGGESLCSGLRFHWVTLLSSDVMV